MNLTVLEYAKLKSVSPARVYQLINKGKLATVILNGKKYIALDGGADEQTGSVSEFVESQKREIESLTTAKAELVEEVNRLRTENGKIAGEYELKIQQLSEQHTEALEEAQARYDKLLTEFSRQQSEVEFLRGEITQKNQQLNDALLNIRLLSAPKGLLPAIRNWFHKKPNPEPNPEK